MTKKQHIPFVFRGGKPEKAPQRRGSPISWSCPEMAEAINNMTYSARSSAWEKAAFGAV